jgi:hypothetical protein
MGFGSQGPRGGAGPRKATIRTSKSRLGTRKTSGCEAYLADTPGLGAIIDSIADAGDAITLGKTSDGSAYAIRILSDDGGERAYEGTQEGLDAVFAALAEHYMPKEKGTQGH